jgi:hypothetical protein
MGDRGNLVMRYTEQDKPVDIYFYTHWRGSELPAILQRALARRQRWTDPAYLSRIIFNTLTEGNEQEETGFGIAPYLCDNEHDLLIVDHEEQAVIRQTEDGTERQRWTFEQFVNLDANGEFPDF